MFFLFMLWACAPKPNQVESFENAWQTVSNSYPYEDFQGVDWQAVHDELLPKAQEARTPADLRPVLRDMLGRLTISHYGIIPAYHYQSDSGPKPQLAPKDSQKKSVPLPKHDGWIGIEARLVESKLTVIKIDPKSSAYTAGVRTGWTINKIGSSDIDAMIAKQDKETSTKSLEYRIARSTSYLLRYSIGSTRTFIFQDTKNNITELKLVAAPLPGTPYQVGHLPNILVRFQHQQLPEGPHLIAFSSFMMPIRAPFEEAMKEVAQSNPLGLIIDLRGNPGGLIGLGSGLAGYLVHKQGLHLGTFITRDGRMNYVVYPRLNSQRYHGPVAILVDELSMSTSEIFAGALQEIKRAKVFGFPTPGMALPSTITQLPNGDRLQYVLGDMKSPSGKPYEGVGVQPNEMIVRQRQDYISGKDPVIEAATRWLLQEARKSAPQAQPK